jgi:hypothetical protein
MRRNLTVFAPGLSGETEDAPNSGGDEFYHDLTRSRDWRTRRVNLYRMTFNEMWTRAYGIMMCLLAAVAVIEYMTTGDTQALGVAIPIVVIATFAALHMRAMR